MARRRIDFIFPLLILIFFLFSTSAWTTETHAESNEVSGRELYSILEVGNGKQYSKIMDAINDSWEGDIILVFPGIYNETLDITKKVIIKGFGNNSTFINGTGFGSTIKILSDDVTIMNLTIQNSGNNHDKGKSRTLAYDCGLWVSGINIKIINCIFRNNPRVSIYIDYLGDHLYVNGCTFYGKSGNHIRFGSRDTKDVNILNNHFYYSSYGIVFYATDENEGIKIINNVFIRKSSSILYSSAISFSLTNSYQSISDSYILKNSFYGGNTAIHFAKSEGLEIAYNDIINCTGYGIDVNQSKAAMIHSNNLINCNYGLYQAINEADPVQWNNSEKIGNYWSDFATRYPQSEDNYGTWNMGYKINGSANACDNYPQVNRIQTNKITLGDTYRNIALDEDRDLLVDSWENFFFDNIEVLPFEDDDNDGLSNLDEFLLSTDPTNSLDPRYNMDRDHDDISDKWELEWFGDLSPGYFTDYDEDGHTDRSEFYAGSDPTDYWDPAPLTDNDSLPDFWENRQFGNCLQGPEDDYDGDGYSNIEEYNWSTDPTDPEDNPLSSMRERSDKIKETENVHFWSIVGIISVILVLIISYLVLFISIFFFVRKSKKEEDGGNYESHYYHLS